MNTIEKEMEAMKSIEEMTVEMEPRVERGGKKILTVGALMEILMECNPDDDVVVGVHSLGIPEYEWLNVSSVNLSDGYFYMAVTLNCEDTFDHCQF
jgi:hypothetical protein